MNSCIKTDMNSIVYGGTFEPLQDFHASSCTVCYSYNFRILYQLEHWKKVIRIDRFTCFFFFLRSSPKPKRRNRSEWSVLVRVCLLLAVYSHSREQLFQSFFTTTVRLYPLSDSTDNKLLFFFFLQLRRVIKLIPTNLLPRRLSFCSASINIPQDVLTP